mmetsp:Transcript_3611/g.10208  ORF Transcript_3611/g.10208 Transcript_3611/m.10208 type:complete len:126 (-) Transcript_3611:1249-1626(-)
MAGSDCNVFQFCKCLRLLGNAMILVVLGLVALSYYPIVVTIYGPAMFDQNISPVKEVAAIFVVSSFHVLVSCFFEYCFTRRCKSTDGAFLVLFLSSETGCSDALELLRGDSDLPRPRSGRLQARR